MARMATANSHLVVGIDFGTSVTRAAVYRNENVEIIPFDNGKKYFPSYVAFTEGGHVVGKAAKQLLLTPNVSNVVFDMKRMIGKTYDDPFIQEAKARWPFQVVPGNDGKLRIEVVESSERKSFSVEEITAMILRHVKQQAELFLGQQVKSVVISIPACFNQTQRKALIKAGDIAGLDVIRLFTDTAMAAVVYAHGLKQSGIVRLLDNQRVLVVNIGGGTTSIAVADIDVGWVDWVEVKSVTGDCNLGGQDFDNHLMDFCINGFARDTGVDLITVDNKLALQKLRRACEKARHTLSKELDADIIIDSLHDDKDLFETVDRNRFYDWNANLFDSIKGLVNRALRNSHLRKEDIDKTIFVGGLAHIPKIRSQLKKLSGSNHSMCYADYETTVVRGLAITATDYMKSFFMVLEVTPFDLGVEMNSGVLLPVVKQNTDALICRTKTFCINGESNGSSGSECRNPLSLGPLRIYEGDRTMAMDNHFVTTYDYSTNPQGIQGHTHLEVTFDVNLLGILSISHSIKYLALSAETSRKRQIAEVGTEEVPLVRPAKNRRLLQVEVAAEHLREKLENYCCNVMDLLEDTNVQDDISESDKQLAVDTCQRALRQRGDERKIQKRLKKTQKKCNPIVAKAFCAARVFQPHSPASTSTSNESAEDSGSEYILSDSDECDLDVSPRLQDA